MFYYLLVIIICIIILFFSIKKINISDNLNLYDDYIFHMSSDTETPLRALNNILNYSKNFTFISINQLSPINVYDNGISKHDLDDITKYNNVYSNFKNHYIQGFTEIKEGPNYMAHKFSIPIGEPIKIEGINQNWAYILKFKRLIDNKEFYFIQLSQLLGNGYLASVSYIAISELLQYIKNNYPGEYIIVGDFKVQGHEKIFQYLLKEKNYHICPFYKYMTCNDDKGLASPDGIVISKKLYNKVVFNVDIYPGHSYQHYMITAKLYINGPIETKSEINPKMLLYMNIIYKARKTKNYINNPGMFDYTKHLGNVNNIKQIQFIESKAVTYSNIITSVILDKLNPVLH